MIDDERDLPGETSVDIVVESAVKKDDAATKKRDADEPTLKVLRKQFKAWLSATDYHRREALDDAKFRAGTWNGKSTQWVGDIQKKREAAMRPCETINRIPGSIRQVTNAQRAADLRIRVNPVGDKGNPKIAEVLQGVIRNIETSSFADRAYATAGDKQAEGGLGYFRLITEFVDDESFRQCVKIKRERNSLRIGLDPAHDLPSGTDAKWSFKYTDLDVEEFKSLTGEAAPDLSAITAFTSEGGDSGEDWFPNGRVRLVEWFNLEPKGPRKRLAELTDGTVIPYPTPEQLAALKTLNAELAAADTPREPVGIKRDRWVQPKQMMWRKCTALKIYEETIWPVEEQPFIQVVGEELEIDGVRDWRGVVRDAKGPARVYNAEVTALIEAVGLGKKASVVGYRGQFGAVDSNQRKAWENAGQEPVAFLEVDPMDIDGKPAPFPQPVQFTMPLEGIVVAIKQTNEDYKTTSGWHDASLGERGPQESGVAIDARKRQDEMGSSHYLDNLRFALVAAGKQLIKLIRVVYDEPQIVRITGDDDREKNVLIFSGAHKDPRNDQFLQTHPPGAPPLTMNDGRVVNPGEKIPFQLPEGVTEIYDLSVGEYDIEVSASHNAGTRRQEALQAVMELYKGLPPEISTKFLDLFFALLDFPTAHQFAERAKKLLPPEFQDQEEGGQPIPPQLAAKVTQMQQQFQELQKAYAEAKQELATKAIEAKSEERIAQMNNDSRERIAAYNAHSQELRLLAEQRGDKTMAMLKAEIDRLDQIIEHRHETKTQLLDAALQPLPEQTPPPDAAAAGGA